MVWACSVSSTARPCPIRLKDLASTAVGALLYFSSMPFISEPLWNLWKQYHSPAAAGLSLAFAMALFATSWLVEAAIFVTWSRSIERRFVVSAVGYANAMTYCVLIVFSFLSL